MSSLLIIGIVVVLLAAIAGTFITKWAAMSHEKERMSRVGSNDRDELRAENGALRERVEQLYDRIETLERIVTDKPSRLASEIDKLDALPPRPERRPAPIDRKDD